jgi:hypothetical protein
MESKLNLEVCEDFSCIHSNSLFEQESTRKVHLATKEKGFVLLEAFCSPIAVAIRFAQGRNLTNSRGVS